MQIIQSLNLMGDKETKMKNYIIQLYKNLLSLFEENQRIYYLNYI